MSVESRRSESHKTPGEPGEVERRRAADIKRWRENLAAEVEGAWLYSSLAEMETLAERRELFNGLAEAETRHADFWRERLAQAGVAAPAFKPPVRARLLVMLARRFSPGFVLPMLARAEMAGGNRYARQADAQSVGMAEEEGGHAQVLNDAARAHSAARKGTADAAGDARVASAPVELRLDAHGKPILPKEKWHQFAGGNSLRAAVLGVNDGLVSNFCLIVGVAGAGADSRTVLLTGLAGLIAGAASMALGEWLSVANARESAERQISREAEEIAASPEAELRELALIYQAKGLPKAQAHAVAVELMKNPKVALDTLVREELGIDPNDLGGDPWHAAVVSFVLFAVGAVCPILPFFFVSGFEALVWCCICAGLALALSGAATALFTGRGMWYSAMRQLLFGALAAALTFGVGRLIGVSVT